jgi:hypothetical protein
MATSIPASSAANALEAARTSLPIMRIVFRGPLNVRRRDAPPTGAGYGLGALESMAIILKLEGQKEKQGVHNPIMV